VAAQAEDTIEIAKRVLQQPECRVSKVVMFAGKEFLMNEQGEIEEGEEQPQAQRGPNLTRE
jgi:hypothetical protein